MWPDTASLGMAWWEAENVRGEEFRSREHFRERSFAGNKSRKRRDYHEPVDRVLKSINAKEMRDRAATAAKRSRLRFPEGHVCSRFEQEHPRSSGGTVFLPHMPVT